MRRGTESGLLGFCRKLTREVLQFADPLRPSAGGKSAGAKNANRRSLRIEPLEVRCYLSGTSFTAQVDSLWFQEVAGGAQNHAGTANWTAAGISSSSTQQQTTTSNSASNTFDWIVQFDTQDVRGITNIAQTASLLAGGGIQFEALCGLGIVGQVLVRSSGAAFETVERWLASDDDVAAFEQDALRQIEATPNDSSISQLWGMSKIDAYGAWNLSTGGGGANRVVVAVIDTGVDYNHQDLAANIWNNPNAGRDGFSGDLHGYDFANNDGNPMDDNGHGTHVAGTIGAVGNNGLGVSGVNWAVSIMPLKFMTATGSGYLSDAIRAINYTTMQRTQYGANVRVINASWGGGGFSSAMQSAIQAAGNAGILFVAAAGNDGQNSDATPHYPAGYNSGNIVAVAASDQNDRLASFSTYGATTVDLAAPGVSIYSTLPGNRYGSLSGTSMATPHVAGAAALAWAYNPTATVAQVRNALLQGVDHLSTLSGKVASGGRLDVLHTLQLLGSGNNVSTAPTIGSLTVSANNVKQGATVELIAAGAALPAGSVTTVYFYRDSNGNGVFDSSDAALGSDATVVGGAGSLSINTTNFAPGTYRFFARALGSNNKYSAAVTTTLAVAANAQSSAPAAAAIAAGTKLSGKLDASRKEVWYQFQAVAGTSYTLRTELVTLRDSVLMLYGRDGKTLLASNDDGDAGLASRIDWVAPQSGTNFFKVVGFDRSLTGDFRVSLVANSVHSSATGVSSFPTVAFSNRHTAGQLNSTRSTTSGERSAVESSAAAATVLSVSMAEATSPISRRETVLASYDRQKEVHSVSLLDRHPGLRSAIGSMLFEEVADSVGPVESVQLNLEALDALFAQLAREDFGG
jgi:subtilisin family serine protease